MERQDLEAREQQMCHAFSETKLRENKISCFCHQIANYLFLTNDKKHTTVGD